MTALLFRLLGVGLLLLALPRLGMAAGFPDENISLLLPTQGTDLRSVTPQTVASLPEVAWTPAPQLIPLNREGHWLRLRFTPDFSGQAALYLVGHTNLDTADFVLRRSAGPIQLYPAGVHVPIAKRGAMGRLHGFIFEAEAGAATEVYFRSAGPFSYHPAFRFERMADFTTYETRTQIFIGFHAALILLGAFFILILGSVLHGEKVDAYLAFSLAMLTASLTTTGTLNVIFETWESGLQSRLASIAVILPVFGSIQFSQSFLSTRVEFPRIHSAFRAAWGITAITLIWRLASPWSAIAELLSSGVLSASLLLLTLLAGILGVRKRIPQAGYFLVAWGVFFTGVAIYVAARSGRIPADYFTLFAPPIAQLVEVVVLIMALIRKFGALFQSKVEGERARTLLRVLSHDLAGSVGATKMSLEQIGELAAENVPASETRPLLEIASRSIATIEGLLGDLREFLSLKSQKLQVKLSPVSLERIQSQMKEDFSNKLSKKGVALEFVGDWDPELSVLAEPESLCRSVLGNALSNAIKFSHPQGTIRFVVRRRQARTELSIEDQGVGMSAELLAKVLDADAQTSRNGTHGERGTGFGMPILAEYTKRYGGEVRVESTEGQGTSVRIFLQSARG